MDCCREYMIDELAAPEGPCRSENLLLPGSGAVAGLFLSAGGASAFFTPVRGSIDAVDIASAAALKWGSLLSGCHAQGPACHDFSFIAEMVPGANYTVRVFPVRAAEPVQVVDIIIMDSSGSVCAVSGGFRMEFDLARPVPNPGFPALPNIIDYCGSAAVVESAAVPGYANSILSAAEAGRYESMGARRRAGFLAGRLACRMSLRKSSTAGRDLFRPGEISVEPCEDGRPLLFTGKGMERLSMECSISHDSRFAIAVAGRAGVGVDVEMISGKAMMSRRLYMSRDEEDLADRSVHGPEAGSVRIWSVKEAVSKASGEDLAGVWSGCRVSGFEGYYTCFVYNGMEYRCVHDTVDSHLFTCVEL